MKLFRPLTQEGVPLQTSIDTAEELANRVENANLLRLVIGYRTHGHRRADLDPLNIVKAE